MSNRLNLAMGALAIGMSLTCGAVDTKNAATLTESLQRYYEPVKAAPASGHHRALFIQRAGLLAVAPNDAAFLDVCPAVFQDGEIHPTPGYFCTDLAHKQQRALGLSDRVYVENLQVNAVADRVEVHLTTCVHCEDPASQVNLRSLVVFQFPRGYLSKAAAEEVIRAMDTLLTAEPVDEPPVATDRKAPPPARSLK